MVVPDKYYVSFPYGVYDTDFLRKEAAHVPFKQVYIVTHEGKSVADGSDLFTFDRDVFVYARRQIRNYETELDEIFKSIVLDNPIKLGLPPD